MTSFFSIARLLVLTLLVGTLSPLGSSSARQDVSGLDAGTTRVVAVAARADHNALPWRLASARRGMVKVRLPGRRPGRLARVSPAAPLFALVALVALVASTEPLAVLAATATSASPRALLAPRPPPVLFPRADALA